MGIIKEVTQSCLTISNVLRLGLLQKKQIRERVMFEYEINQIAVVCTAHARAGRRLVGGESDTGAPEEGGQLGASDDARFVRFQPVRFSEVHYSPSSEDL